MPLKSNTCIDLVLPRTPTKSSSLQFLPTARSSLSLFPGISSGKRVISSQGYGNKIFFTWAVLVGGHQPVAKYRICLSLFPFSIEMERKMIGKQKDLWTITMTVNKKRIRCVCKLSKKRNSFITLHLQTNIQLLTGKRSNSIIKGCFRREVPHAAFSDCLGFVVPSTCFLISFSGRKMSKMFSIS